MTACSLLNAVLESPLRCTKLYATLRLQSFTGDRLREDEKGLSAEPADLQEVHMDPQHDSKGIDAS